MGLPGTALNLGQKIKKKKNLKVLDFEFCPRFKSVLGNLHFPLL